MMPKARKVVPTTTHNHHMTGSFSQEQLETTQDADWQASEEKIPFDEEETEKYRILSRAFDCHDQKTLEGRVELYVAIVEQLIEQGVVTEKRDIIDWAVAYAFTNGEWYGDKLTTRLQNAMIVSALLLTVSATFFISPPELDSTSYRVFSYACGISSLLFMLSIVTGVQFIENAMSRAYSEYDRFNLIVRQYSYMNFSQVCAYLGGVSFPIFLAIPIRSNNTRADSFILYVILLVGFAYLTWISSLTNRQAALEQKRRIDLMEYFTDDKGQLKHYLYPKSCKWQPINGVFDEFKRFVKKLDKIEDEVKDFESKFKKQQ